ncbi:MAG TPA: hypothetical protein VLB69_07885 [Rudaea sp.]|nr:hypothetical protein [Rudaea sp.]
MLIAAAASPVSADAEDTGERAQAQRIVPVFDCYRTNSAWGFTLSGKVIDADGNIYSYGRRGKGWLATPVKEQDATYYSEADLLDKFAGARRSGSVDAAALVENTQLIEAARSGKLSIVDGGARDAGYSGCHAYVRDASHARYRDVDLGSDGGVTDMHTTSDAPAATQLLHWLQSVGVAQ